jgi:hypothetical protein
MIDAGVKGGLGIAVPVKPVENIISSHRKESVEDGRRGDLFITTPSYIMEIATAHVFDVCPQ